MVECASVIDVDGARVVKELMELAKFSDHANPAVTRILFTPNDMLARDYIKSLMRDAELEVREDAMGNIFGRWEGTQANGAVLTGSHCDAIPLAGMYDGTLGVVGAIEALRALKKAGYQPRRPLEVMMFTSEEPTRFALSCSGSRAMARTLTPDALAAKLDENGTDWLTAANSVGYGAASYEELLAATAVAPGAVDYFVELHIEQGPLLEAEQVDIGVVTAIAGPAALEVTFTGSGGHAGGLMMRHRNDALLAGAKLAQVVEEAALTIGTDDTVATTGVFEVQPGAVNSVPRVAKLGIDVRDTDAERHSAVLQHIVGAVEPISKERKVNSSVRMINHDQPAVCSDEVQAAVQAAADALGLSTRKMVSRAYHDSLFMAQVAPTGMVFIPCRGGWSHRPDEFASERDIANGVGVLALAMARLSGGTFPAAAKVEL